MPDGLASGYRLLIDYPSQTSPVTYQLLLCGLNAPCGLRRKSRR